MKETKKEIFNQGGKEIIHNSDDLSRSVILACILYVYFQSQDNKKQVVNLQFLKNFFTNLSLGSPQCRSHQRLGTEILEDPDLISGPPLVEMSDTYRTL